MQIIDNITSYKELDIVMDNHNYVILKFGAKWCKPCQEMKTEFKSYIDNLDTESCIVVDIDIDDFEDIDQHFTITKIPFFIIYENKIKKYEFNSSQMNVIKTNFEIYTNDNKLTISEDF
jgi:thiol-disulfide isomerase/thioredoxin